MTKDLSDPGAERMAERDRLRILQNLGGGGGDSEHPGTGANSVALGPGADAFGTWSVAVGDAEADDSGTALGDSSYADKYAVAAGLAAHAFGQSSVSIGDASTADAEDAVTIGRFAEANGARSVALGPYAEANADDEYVLGNSAHNVKVPGTLTVTGVFSNPSARHLKTNIVEAPCLRDVFPPRYEYEYLARQGERRLGHMADELVGTEAERFVLTDEHGDQAIDYLGLYGAQIYALRAEVVEQAETIAQLRAENDEMKARLTALEELVKGPTNG